MKKLLCIFLLIFFSISFAYSESVSINLDSSVKTSTANYYLEGGLSDSLGGAINAEGDFYNIDVNLSLINDGKYPTHSSFQLGHYFYTTESVAEIFFGDLSFSAGRGVHTDVVDTPYSIYVNPEALPSVYAEAVYSGDLFSYQSRWVRLNERSAQLYNGNIDSNPDTPDYIRDRGMTFKTYALDLGNLRIGLEDVSLYLDRSFDSESFLSPFPMYFLEMLNTSGGRPWSEISNTNSLMGFFSEYEKSDLYLQGQILVDDINASILAPALGWAIPSLNNITNLSKVAWSLGGHYDTPFGRIGLYHGGALKYTFEATYTNSTSYSSLPYEYTYYPITEYNSGGGYSPMDYTENYIGYKYGENNISFLIDYQNQFFTNNPYSFDLYTSLEWILNGSKSPSNPWHEYTSWTEIDVPYELLSDDVIEHTLKLQTTISKPYRNWLFTVDGGIGYVWNRLELVELVSNEPKIYVPISGNNHLLASLSISASYLFKIKK